MLEWEFGRLLTIAIKCMAAHEGKSIGETQQWIADELGWNVHMVRRWQRGERMPERREVEWLAEQAILKGRMPPDWLGKFLKAANFQGGETLIERLLGNDGYRCEFLDDRETDRGEIFARVREHVLQARRRLWVLNAHPREPSLEDYLTQIRCGEPEKRVRSLKSLLRQHTYYKQLITRAADMPGEFEYIRIVQLDDVNPDRPPRITLANTGYSYVYHFYDMLKKREQLKDRRKQIKAMLYAGTLLRDATFLIIDDHTLLWQVSGLRREMENGIQAQELRGLLTIQKRHQAQVVQQVASLYEHLWRGPHQGHIINVTLEDLSLLVSDVPLLENVLAPDLRQLLDDLWRIKTYLLFWETVQTVYDSEPSALRQIMCAEMMPAFKKQPDWSEALAWLLPDSKLRECLD